MRLAGVLHAKLLTPILLSSIAAASTTVPVATPALGGEPQASLELVAEAPAPAVLWSAAALQDLKAEIAAAAAEGLDPIAYGGGVLDLMQPSPDTDRAAGEMALALAEDYARGRVEDPQRFGWHIERPVANRAVLEPQMRAALKDGRVRSWLRGLLPSDERYGALRSAYAQAKDEATRMRLRANLERWRWMPRSLGSDYIYVNVPSYTLLVVDERRPVSSYTVVVGKPSTPTPQIAVEAKSVVVNPWWNVPPSIASKMKGGAGYVRDGRSIRQPPGPRNALGKVKIDMPNPHSIYLHDTPSKSLFAEQSRTFSHGCIRVKDIDRLARELVALDRGEVATVDRALASSATRTVPLPQSRPVYLVYFTMDLDADGKLATLEDPYGRDLKVIASLDRATQMAAAKTLKFASRN